MMMMMPGAAARSQEQSKKDMCVVQVAHVRVCVRVCCAPCALSLSLLVGLPYCAIIAVGAQLIAGAQRNVKGGGRSAHRRRQTQNKT